MMKHTKGFLLTLGALMLAPAIANAELPRQDPHGSAALLVGYGFKDGANFGLGARGGYTLEQGFYIGGNLMYHLGKEVVNVWYFGAEGGYDFQLEPVTIRPYIGLGPGFVNADIPEFCIAGQCVGGSQSNTYFAFWFGGSALYNINEQWFVGGDLKFPFIDGEVFPTLAFTGGLNF